MRVLVLVTALTIGLSSVATLSLAQGHSSKLPNPPPLSGRCVHDWRARRQCDTEWYQCVSTAHRGENLCPREWETCCRGPRSEAPEHRGG